MTHRTAHTAKWLADLEDINAEIARLGLPYPAAGKGARRRSTKSDAWWEE